MNGRFERDGGRGKEGRREGGRDDEQKGKKKKGKLNGMN